MIYRCILPKWAPGDRRVCEGLFDADEIEALNSACYNIYYLPNFPSDYAGGTVDGAHIDTFGWVFVDFDLKSGAYASKDAFIERVCLDGPQPTKLVDSGGGVHAYWKVTGMDAMSYLRLSRRLMRKFNTDPAVGQIYQLMRVPGTVNTKDPENPRPCELLFECEKTYTCEELDRLLPPITTNDEQFCKQHYAKTYSAPGEVQIKDKLPMKFGKLLRNSKEAKEIWSGNTDDRSKGDYRLGHLMFATGFTREEAMSVLVNSAKAIERAPVHRLGYAQTIVDKIWTFEMEGDDELNLSTSVRDILEKSAAAGDDLKGTRFACYRYIDATHHGFRLGQIIGLVAGSGVGKTAMALNMFLGFVEQNPNYVHFFVSLEQPANEIAERWQTMVGNNPSLYEKVHVLSNYSEDGSHRRLSLEDIQDYLLKFQSKTEKKIGCVVIDHIGALKRSSHDGRQSIEDICHEMKGFAVELNVMLVMQSQAPREKAGIGDIELNKDAAYGTVFFESYCDYLVTIWQPLKRCYNKPDCPTVTAFKFCKIRHKKVHLDEAKEDVCYRLLFDPETEKMRELTQAEEKSFDFFNKTATGLRKKDRKTDIVAYSSIKWTQEEIKDGKADSDSNPPGTESA